MGAGQNHWKGAVAERSDAGYPQGEAPSQVEPRQSHSRHRRRTCGGQLRIRGPVLLRNVDGELHWKTDLGVLNSGWFYDPSYEWGFSSSPILHRGRVIVQVDIQQDSFLSPPTTSRPASSCGGPSRDEIPTWGTPTILPAKRGVGSG